MKTIVVKIGSSIIAPGGKIDQELFGALIKDIVSAGKKDCGIILVSSGAIACGANKLGIKKKPSDCHSLMALASVGQILLMDAYNREFGKHNLCCGQILLSWDDFDSRRRFLNARYTIAKLLSLNIVPVINENDAVSDEEIKFGDNDRLSALVADCAGSEALVILSDVEGLLDGDKKVVKRVERVDDKIYSLIRKKEKDLTSGGMFTKLEAAKICVAGGIKMIIAGGRVPGVISRIASGEECGTSFLPREKITAKKRWIAFSKKTKGRIYIDDGAKEAILNRGKSLLSVGIVKVEGDFKKKDSVEVADKEGCVLGVGMVNYSSQELVSCGKQRLAKEVIHRDNLAWNRQ